MLILLTKSDAKRILALDHQVAALQNDLNALRQQWDTELLALADLKEQILNLYKRLDQRDRRKTVEVSKAEPSPEPSQGSDRITQRILERRRKAHALPQVAG